MKKMKKTLLLGLSILLCQTVNAKIIDLDMENGDHCRQQLYSTPDDKPVVLTYFEGSKEADAFMPIYESVAKNHPERAFFRFKYNEAFGALTREAISVCLRQLGSIGETDFKRITVWLFERVIDPDTEQAILIGPFNAGPNKNTQEELEKFIQFSNSSSHVSFPSRRHLVKEGHNNAI